MNELFQSEFCVRLCWTLAHSLWQVGAVAMVASIFAFALRRRSASARYNVYLAGLLVSLAAFPVTFWLLRPVSEAVALAPRESIPIAITPAEPTAAVAFPEVTTTAPILPAVEIMSPVPRAPQLAPEPLLSRFVPWIAIAYLVGVCAMAVRLAMGMWSAGALSRRAAGAGCELTGRLERIARQWKLRVVPRLAVSAEVVVPKVVGILRPVILLPLSAATGLAPDQLDMILAHELAHVRRHDLWVNLLQRIAETLLFFNPAIWYLSRRLTTLREDASDELVCSGAAERATRYAAALVRVAELSRPCAAAEIAAVAATGRSPSELRRRVARLVGEPLREPVRLTRGGVLTLAMIAVVALVGPGVWRSSAESPAEELSDSESDQESESNTTQVRELRSGAKVTLLGIGTHGAATAQWWDGDGTPLEGVAYRLEGPRGRPSEKAVVREVAFRVENVPDDAVIRMETKPIDGTPAEVVWRYGSLPGKYGGMVFIVPKDRPTFKLRVGVAGGDWQTLTTSQPTSAQATGILGDTGIVFSEAYSKGDDTVVIVSHNMEDENTRVVAIDKAGSEFIGERAGRVSAVGGVNQATWRFPNLLPESIEEFKFQTRLFLWAEFNELPVDADNGKEAVEYQGNGNSHELALLVVGPDGKPVPNATIGIRSTPVLANEQIRRGTFVKGSKSGATVKADDSGRATVLFSKRPSYLGMSIEHPSFGPYFAEWNSETGPQKIPHEFTFELEGAYSMGGVVVDERGNSIEDVEISPSIRSKMRPGDNEEIGSGIQVKTDANGSWRFDSVPNSKAEVFVEISHPKYKPLRRRLERKEFTLAEGETPTKQIVLEQGLIVTGTVTDNLGKPIADALVRTKFFNDIREAKTDENGNYELIGCEPAMARIVVSAKGKALDMKEVRVSEDMEPVDFQMKPGGTVRLRVVDENGEPIPKTRIFFQHWRGQQIEYFEFDHVNQYADENGIWEWNEAPLDGFQADICPPGGMQLSYHPLIARDEEYVISPPQALVVSGTVIDAETKQPVKSFRVIPGTRESGTVWARRDIVEAAGGKYQIRRTRGSAAGHLIRIEADGYQATVSRNIENDEGNVTLNFELQRGQNVAAQVLTPEGEPAVGAKVALGVAKSQISVENGEIDDGSTYAARLDTDQEGRFSFPPQDAAYQLVLTHPSGIAHIKGTPDGPPEKIELTPWARVEGTFRVGKEPQPNVSLRLYSEEIRSFGEGVASIFTDHQATTGPEGRFVFPRVIPGDGWVGRDILLMVDDGAQEVTSSARIKGQFPAGKTTDMQLGGDGQPVIGRLAPPDDFEEKVFWNFALIHVRADPPPPIHPQMPVDVQALPEKRQAWWFDFLKTDEGKAAMPTYQAYAALRDSKPHFSATVAPDGTFRIDDMPDGDYSLSVRFSKFGPGKIQNLRFMVPPTGGEAFDLGVIELER